MIYYEPKPTSYEVSEGKLTLHFGLRSTNIKLEHLQTLKALEATNIEVRLHFRGDSSKLYKVDELDQAYKDQTSFYSPQTMANYKTDVRKLAYELLEMAPSNPRYTFLMEKLKQKAAIAHVSWKTIESWFDQTYFEDKKLTTGETLLRQFEQRLREANKANKSIFDEINEEVNDV